MSSRVDGRDNAGSSAANWNQRLCQSVFCDLRNVWLPKRIHLSRLRDLAIPLSHNVQRKNY